jgi:hypothetical protein
VANGDELVRGKKKSCGCLVRKSRPRTNGDGIDLDYYYVIALNTLYRQYRLTAKRRRILFQLTKEEFAEITGSNCWYCGVEPNTFVRGFSQAGAFVANGIDRIDNSKGYVSGNVRACCPQCNYAKFQMSEGEFLGWVERIAAYQHAKNIKPQ